MSGFDIYQPSTTHTPQLKYPFTSNQNQAILAPIMDMTPSVNLDESLTEAEYEKFYTAAQVQEQQAMETLLSKGLYGDRLPKPLRGQKAANAFQHAFDLIGGVPRLALWADKNPSAFFALYSKLIPSTVQAQVQSTVRIEAPWMNPDRLAYREQQQLDTVVDVTPSDPSVGNGS